MANTQLQAFIDGNDSGPTVVFVHGWPDDHTLWDLQVAHLKDRFRCVTTDLPGFSVDSVSSSKWGYSFEDITTRLENTIEAVGAGKPVILVAHDWGCSIAYTLEKKRPDLVQRMVALDAGGAIDLKPSLSLFAIVTYQAYLNCAFLIGGPIGNLMARAFARLVGAPQASTVARASVCYPYFYFWKALFTGTKMEPFTPRCPFLYMYGCRGLKKIMTFHADWWVNKINNREGSAVVEVADASHWIMRDRPDVVNRQLDAFFA